MAVPDPIITRLTGYSRTRWSPRRTIVEDRRTGCSCRRRCAEEQRKNGWVEWMPGCKALLGQVRAVRCTSGENPWSMSRTGRHLNLTEPVDDECSVIGNGRDARHRKLKRE